MSVTEHPPTLEEIHAAYLATQSELAEIKEIVRKILETTQLILACLPDVMRGQ